MVVVAAMQPLTGSVSFWWTAAIASAIVGSALSGAFLVSFRRSRSGDMSLLNTAP